MPKPNEDDENYDFLSGEFIAYAIANQELTDVEPYLHSECYLSAKISLEVWFPMRFEREKEPMTEGDCSCTTRA